MGSFSSDVCPKRVPLAKLGVNVHETAESATFANLIAAAVPRQINSSRLKSYAGKT